MRKLTVLSLVLVLSLTASLSFAAATIEQKTQVKFGGFLGGVINVFGGKATKEGVTTTSIVKGDRRCSVTGNAGELVDLKEEKIYQIDFGRKSYKVVTFEELRKQFEDAQQEAKKQQREAEKQRRDAEAQRQEGPELQVDVDVTETGKKQTINGYDTRQVVMTVTAHEKGKTLEDSGGAVLTADMWMGPRLAAMKELEDFERKYFTKLYGNMMGAGDLRSMAMLMVASPEFGKVMKKLQDRKASLQGTAIRSALKFETVAGPQEQADPSSSSGGDVTSKMIGGLLSRAKQKREAKQSGEPAAANRRMLFSSSSELLSVSATADSGALSVPAGFSQR